MPKLDRTPHLPSCTVWKKKNLVIPQKKTHDNTMNYGVPKNHARAQPNNASQRDFASDTSTTNSFNQQSTSLAEDLQYTNPNPSNAPSIVPENSTTNSSIKIQPLHLGNDSMGTQKSISP